MKNLLIVFTFCFPIFLFSQSQLEVVGSLDVTGSSFGWDGIAGNIRNLDNPKLNTHFGVHYHQQLKNRWWLKIGIGFASLGYKTGKTELLFGSQITGQGNDPLFPNGGSVQFKKNYQFLEIPVALRVDFSDKKWKTFSEFGISTMYYLQTVNQLLVEDHDMVDSTTDKFRDKSINQIQLATVLALGVSYTLNEKIEFILKPNFRYHLTKMAKGASKEREWGAGLALGARFFLK